jgi:putative ABC transport system substrate-binding protein
MRRRDFIAEFASAAALIASQRPACAQQRAMPVVGILSPSSVGTGSQFGAAVLRGLAEAGYVEGRNLAVEYRWAEGRYDRLSSLAADLAGLRVDVIVTVGGVNAALAAKAATTTIPIVFETGVNPVEFGLIASLNRPGGNLTGITDLNLELTPKRLEVLHELVPTATSIAVFANPSNPATETITKQLERAAQALSLRLVVLRVGSQSDFEGAFATLVEQRADALMTTADPVFGSQLDHLFALGGE